MFIEVFAKTALCLSSQLTEKFLPLPSSAKGRAPMHQSRDTHFCRYLIGDDGARKLSAQNILRRDNSAQRRNSSLKVNGGTVLEFN